MELITTVLTAAEALLPLVEREYETLSPVVSNMIAGAMSAEGITDEQLARAQELRQKADAAYDAAKAARAAR